MSAAASVDFLHASRLFLRLRLRRFANQLSMFGRRRGAAGRQRPTAKKSDTAGLLGVLVFLFMMLVATSYGVSLVGASHRAFGRSPAAFRRSLVFEASLLWILSVLYSIGDRELARPEWDLEWLATLPAPMSTLLGMRVVQRTVINPVGVAGLVPYLSVLAWRSGLRVTAPLAGAGVALVLLFLAALVQAVADTGLRMVWSPPRLRNLQAIAAVVALALLYALMSATTPGSTVLHWAERAPAWADWLPPGLAARALAGAGASASCLALLLLETAACAAAAFALLAHLLRNGVVRGGEREAVRRAPAHGAGNRPPLRARRLLTPIQARELRLLLRDRAYLARTLIVPALVIVYYLLQGGGGIVASARHSAAALGALAFGLSAWIILLTSMQVLTNEGQALWLLYTSPRPLDRLLREKALLWAAISAVFPIAIVTVGLRHQGLPSLRGLGSLAVALAGVPLYSLIGAALGVFASDPLATEQQRRVKPQYMYLGMALVALYVFAILAPHPWWSAVTLVLTVLVAIALWQRARDRLPYLLDPSAAPPPRVSLSDGLVAALLFFVAQGVAGLLLVEVVPWSPATVAQVAYLIAGAVTYAVVRLVFHLRDTAGVPHVAPERWGGALGKGVLGGLAAAGLGVAYAVIAPHIGPLERLLQEASPRAASPLLFACVVIGAPIFEEFIFRGLIFGGLRRSVGAGGAALASAAIFAIVHPPVAVVPVFCLGLVTALVYERTRALAAPMAVHALYNAAVVGLAMLGRHS